MERESADTYNNSSPNTQSIAQSTSVLRYRLGMCEVCANNAAKYTCPRCEVKTCCLCCAKIHKQELECDGIRDKTKFIPLNKFTNLDLLSDYRLLEEITRNVESLKKSGSRRCTRHNGDLPVHLHRLRKAAMARKTKLAFLPQNFMRHRDNTSYLHFRSNVVFWHIEWIFSSANHLKLSDDNVPETTKLSNLLHKHFKQEDNNIQEKLQFYRAVDLPGIRLFLKAEQKSGCKYYELDPLASVKDNLKNKTIIEYPVIHVVLQEHVTLYDVLNSDDEEDEMDVDVKHASGKEIVNQIIAKAEKEDSSSKNLLFVSEQSEDERSDTE